MLHHLNLRKKLIIMGSVMASLFLVALDQTIVATALGKIVEDLRAFDSLSWIVTAYLLTTTVTVPIAGKLSDLYGRKKLLLVGVGVFLVGSLFSGAATNIEMLIIARAIQGVGGGIITANAFTIVGDLFAARERGRWQGLIGAVFGLSSLVGPLLGGWLTDGVTIFNTTTDWRWTFYINIPVAIIAFGLIAYFCPPLRRDKQPIVDYGGATLLAIALAVFILAVDNTEMIFSGLLSATGWSLVVLRIILFTIVALAITGFVFVERAAREPILPLWLFKNRNFVLIIGIATLFGAGFMGAILYLTQFNQQVFGASPTESGLMLLPMVAGLMVTSISSGQIIARTGRYKVFMQAGIVLATIMLAAMTTLSPYTPYWHEAIMMVLLGAGLGAVMPVISLAVQNEFSHHELGVATSSSQLFRSLGSTVGVAIFGAILTAGLATGLNSGAQDHAYIKMLQSSPLASQMGDMSDPNTLLGLNMPDTREKITGAFMRGIQQLPEPARQGVVKDFNDKQSDFSNTIAISFSDSLRKIFISSTILMSIATVLVFSLKERPLRSAKLGDAPGVA